MFTVAPPIAQAMDIIREEAGFLNRIGYQSVTNMKGETIGLDIGSTVASVTKTSGTTEERTPTEVLSLEKSTTMKSSRSILIQLSAMRLLISAR